MAESTGLRVLLLEFVGGAPRPCRDGLLKVDRRGPLDFLSSLRCEGEDGGAGDDEASQEIFRQTDSGEWERRFFCSGPAGESKGTLGDIVS
jgi:hypothetical protein